MKDTAENIIVVEDNETKKQIFKTNNLDEIMTPLNLRGEAGLRVFEVTPATTMARDLSPAGNTAVLSSHKHSTTLAATMGQSTALVISSKHNLYLVYVLGRMISETI